MFTGPPDVSSKLLERLELAVRFPRMEMLVRLLLRPRVKLAELLELLATWMLESSELVNWRLLVLASWPSRKSCCPSGATNCPSRAKLAAVPHFGCVEEQLARRSVTLERLLRLQRK